METILDIQNLSKKFGKVYAVNQLNLTVSKGEVFGLLGPNGSGKTTTLGMLMGVVHPSAGRFTWFGETSTHDTRKRIGAVLEHPIFYPYLSGQKNLELNALIKKIDKAHISKVLDIVDLTNFKDNAYKTYSLGMKQRLAIAAALMNDPTILILDEPTNGLDPMGIAEIRDITKRIALTGKTIILASHLLDEVQKVCTQFAILHKGRLIHVGHVKDIDAGEEIVEVMAPYDELANILNDFIGCSHVKKTTHFFELTMKKGFHSLDINRYLCEKNILVSHLSTKRKSLENKFLEVLSTEQ